MGGHALARVSTTRADLGSRTKAFQHVWLPGNDLQDPATWHAPSLCQLKRMHEDLLQHYDCTDQQASTAQQAPPSGAGGGAAANADANPQPQPAGSQDNGNVKLVLPQLHRLHEAFKRSQVFPPGVLQRSGPAHSAQAHSVATPSHPAAHPGMAPVQGPPPAPRGHAF